MSWFENKAGYRLWYEELGSGRPIIFIHGWCMSSAVWKLQQEALSGTFRIITLDLMGHGNSPQRSDRFQIRGCADDVAGLLEYLDLHDAIIAGWSLGATIAIESSLLCKERLSGLILISGTPRFVQAVEFLYGLPTAEAEGMAKKVSRNKYRALAGFITRTLAPGEAGFMSVHELLSAVPLPSIEVALQALQALVEADVRDRLAMIDCPVMIISGDQDVICLPEASQFMSRQIPDSQLIVFSGCGHVPFLTQSRKFNACIEEFGGG